MLSETRTALKQNRSVLIQSACGSGKGVITTEIINGAIARGRQVLFIVRGRDRVSDMEERVARMGLAYGILMGNRKRQSGHAVQIASSDTVWRMDEKPAADLIVVDECHLGLSPTFRGVLNCYPNVGIIGMSATPMLGNNRPLGLKSGGIFEAMVKGPSVKQLIKDGHLVGSRVIAPPAPQDLAGLKKKSTGEFDSEQGAAICDTTKVIGDIVSHWQRYSSDRKTVAFGFNQKHAWDIAASFRAAGINWEYVDADTPDGDPYTPGTRKFIWKQFDRGDLMGIASCNVISLGWDHSICKTLLLCSKTSAFPLYHQRLGRGSRPHRGFDHFRVHDHCGGLYEFIDRGAMFESDIDWQLDGETAVRVASKDEAVSVKTCKVPVRMPFTGVPASFTGPVDGGWLLPCYRAFEAGPVACPYCGLPLEKDKRVIKTEAGELQDFDPATRITTEAQIRTDPRKADYLDLTIIARNKGWKPGYPAMQFKAKYGYWPSKGWKHDIEQVIGCGQPPLERTTTT